MLTDPPAFLLCDSAAPKSRRFTFSSSLSFIFVLFCLPLLFFPKINLITVGGGETAGIRVDDFILLLFFLFLMWGCFLVRKRPTEIEGWVVAIIFLSLISFLSNYILVNSGKLYLDSKLYYCFRILEYFLFFYIGAMAVQFIQLSTVIHVFFLWNLLLMILQKIGFLGAFSSSNGYQAQGDDRLFGIASFPSEMGALLNFIFCFYLYEAQQKKYKSISLYFLFLLFAVLTILTGSRVAIVALVVSFLFFLKKQFLFRHLFFLIFSVIIILFIIFQTKSLVERSQGLLSWRNVNLAADVWDLSNIEKVMTVNDHDRVSYEGEDMSWWIRIHKWGHLLKTYFSHPECYLQGIGPGCAWAALDGGWLRILVEYGVIGFFLFWKFFMALYRVSPLLEGIMVAFILNMIFFDAYLAYKLMSVLFFIAGYQATFINSSQDSAERRNYESSRLSL